MCVVNGLFIQICCAASFEVPTMPPEGSPLLGLRGSLPGNDAAPFGPLESAKGGFGYGISLQSTYDSNFFLTESDPSSELTTDVLPWISYSSDPDGAAPFSVTARYQPNIRTYLNHPDLNGVDQSGGATMTVRGAKTVISTSLNYSTLSGTDRLSGTFVTGSVLAAGISGSYQIAPRTSLFANLRASKVDYASGAQVGSDDYSADVGGYWSATERFSFGPSISFDRETSDNTGTRDAWALNMQARYLAGEKLTFVGSLGLQYSVNSREQGKGKLAPVGGLAAIYAINERLQWNNSVQYSTVPSATEVNYMINDLAVSTSLTRQFVRSSASIGLQLNISDYQEVGTVGTKLGNQDDFSAFLAYRRTLFSDRLNFDSSIRYTVNQGQTDWNQFQIAVGLSYDF